MEYKLLASAPSEAEIIKAISRFYCGATISLEGENIHNLKGLIDGVRVIKKRGRYRFEMVSYSKQPQIHASEILKAQQIYSKA